MICLSQDSLCVVTRVQLARLIILLVVRSTISPHQPQSMPGQIMPLRTGTAPPASQNTRHLEPPGAASQERSGSSSGNINYWHPPLSLSPGPNNVAKHVSNIISDTSHIFHFREERIYNFISLCSSSLLTMTLTNWQSGIHIISRGIKVGKTKKLSRPSLRKWLSFF